MTCQEIYDQIVELILRSLIGMIEKVNMNLQMFHPPYFYCEKQNC